MTVGQLYGLHTLNQILKAVGLRSNQWSKVCKKLTIKQIEISVNAILQGVLKAEVLALARKSESTWSRAEPTIIVDDSIFKQWLSKEPIGTFFAKYFSGQTKCGVYGFRVTLCGMSLNGTFFPSGLCLTTKTEDTVTAACRLVEALHQSLCELKADNGLDFPNLFVSADNGFEGLEMLEKCEELSRKLAISPICVPKKTQKIQIGDCKMSLAEAVECFVELEKDYLARCQQKKQEPEPFTLRRRAFLNSRQRKMTLLFFRLKGGKVCVVYSPDLNIKAKTLRRRWFQRTQIEQFFRLLKDTLKIQQAKNMDKQGFERKLFVFVFQALQCQLFRNFCRRKFRILKGWAFPRIRQRITFENIERDWLIQLLAAPNRVLHKIPSQSADNEYLETKLLTPS